MRRFARQIEPTDHVQGSLFDWQHLETQTMGDPDLAQEILELFVVQVQGLADVLDRSTADERRFLAHGLRGSASGVGALPLAKAAKTLEAEPSNSLALAQLGTLIGATLAEIRQAKPGLRG